MYGMMTYQDPLGGIQGMVSIYTTHANLTLAYNLGAMGGVALGFQIGSGILVGMTYVASDSDAFTGLDQYTLCILL